MRSEASMHRTGAHTAYAVAMLCKRNGARQRVVRTCGNPQQFHKIGTRQYTLARVVLFQARTWPGSHGMIFYALRWKVLRPTCCISISCRFCGGCKSISIIVFVCFGHRTRPSGPGGVVLMALSGSTQRSIMLPMQACSSLPVSCKACELDKIPQCSRSGCSCESAQEARHFDVFGVCMVA